MFYFTLDFNLILIKMVKAKTFLFKLGVTGPEKDKMAANFIPTSVVSFLPSIIHNNYQHIKSLDFEYKIPN